MGPLMTCWVGVGAVGGGVATGVVEAGFGANGLSIFARLDMSTSCWVAAARLRDSSWVNSALDWASRCKCCDILLA